jgi:radical SAM-linked protein
MSLPLPRSVGVESDDELLCLRVTDCEAGFDAEEFKTRLSVQLPMGLQLVGVDVSKAKMTFSARAATYVFDVRWYGHNEKLNGRIKELLSCENLEIERRANAKGSVRSVDVRVFLKSVEFDDSRGIITVECKISPAGTIRVDEILRLLELEREDLAGPIRRTKVQWQGSS